MNPTGKDPFLRRLELSNWVILGIVVGTSYLLMSDRFTLGIIVGGLISVVNFYWLEHDLYKIFCRLNERAKSRVMFKYYIRFAATALILYLVVTTDILNIIGLIVGLSTVIINIILTAVILLTKKNYSEEVK